MILLNQLVKINLNCRFETFNEIPDLSLIVEQADIAKLEIQLSSMESKYVRMYQILEAVEKCEMCQQQINLLTSNNVYLVFHIGSIMFYAKEVDLGT